MQVLWSLEILFCCLFTLEAALETFAFNFTSYIKQRSNQVDLLIAAVSVIVLVVEDSTAATTYRPLIRLMSIVKPLRLFTRSKGLLHVTMAIWQSLAGCFHVTLLCVLLWLIFAMLGVQLFAGRLYSCNDTTVSGKAECIGNFIDPSTYQSTPRVWSNMFFNFDSLWSALMTLFIPATQNGFSPTMYACMNAPDAKDVQPSINSNWALGLLYFVGFITIVVFVLMSLYTGVVFGNFSKLRNESELGSVFLTEAQQQRVELTRMVFYLKPATAPAVASKIWLRR